MKAIFYLKQIEIMDARINSITKEIQMLLTLATNTTSAMGGEKVQASGSQEKIADCVAKMIDLQSKLTADIDKLLNYRKEAFNILLKCDSDHIELLYKRYFEYKDWQLIAEEMGFSYKWVSSGLHQRALARFQKALDSHMALVERVVL